MSKSNSLVALPPIHVASFSKWNPERKDDIFLYSEGAKDQSIDRDKYRYKLTIVDHPGLIHIAPRNARNESRGRRTTSNGDRPKTSVSFTYTHATFIIPAGRESEYMFSSLSGLWSIVRSANAARLIAVAIGRNYDTSHGSSLESTDDDGVNVDPLQIVQDELRYVIQVISSAIPIDVLESTLTMKPNAPSLTFYPFLAVHGIGQRNIIDAGETTTSGRYIVEQCAISSPDMGAEIPSVPKWVRRLYFLDGNPYVIQSEVSLIPKGPAKTIHGVDDLVDQNNDSTSPWVVDKSVTAFEYHKSLTAGLFALLTATSCTGMVIGLGGGSLINYWHYLLGEGSVDDATFQSPWNVTAVELDETVLRIANQHFGLNLSHPGFSYRIGDGLNIHPAAEPTEVATLGFSPDSFDFIVIDVDSKDAGAGMSCPPVAFVEPTYLQSLYALLQPNGGILAINVAARDITLFEATCQSVQSVFGKVILSKQYPGRVASVGGVAELALDDDDDEPEDLNVVVFAIRTSTNDGVNSIPPVVEMTDNVARWMQLKSLNITESKTPNHHTIQETDAILQSELCECLQDFIMYESIGSNGEASPGPKKKKSGNNKGKGSRRKKR